ncbi:hypothetical protein AERO_18675, partial [Aeromicrobium fastidiosum]|uniref:hypothetical protein n=1 Tax=Aeromicrobium fastidiosum TaxID=52699 RepID=UPI002023411B
MYKRQDQGRASRRRSGRTPTGPRPSTTGQPALTRHRSRRAARVLSLIHISEPTRLSQKNNMLVIQFIGFNILIHLVIMI